MDGGRSRRSVEQPVVPNPPRQTGAEPPDLLGFEEKRFEISPLFVGEIAVAERWPIQAKCRVDATVHFSAVFLVFSMKPTHRPILIGFSCGLQGRARLYSSKEEVQRRSRRPIARPVSTSRPAVEGAVSGRGTEEPSDTKFPAKEVASVPIPTSSANDWPGGGKVKLSTADWLRPPANASRSGSVPE